MEIKSRGIGIRRIFAKVMKIIIDFPLTPARFRTLIHKITGVNFEHAGSTFVGRGVTFDEMYPEKIFVGENTIITSGCIILSHYLDVKKPIHTFYHGEVVIGKNVCIGANSVIIKPITVGDGAVIAAGSIVNKDVSPNTIVGGNPAKVIGVRNPDVK